MNIVLLCPDDGNQVALAHKVAAQYSLVGIVVEKRIHRQTKRYSFKKIINAVADRTLFRKMRQSWFDLLARYRNEYPTFPPVKKLETTSINSDAVKNFIGECNADLVIVSGTSMIKKNILDIPLQKGMLNLHTGLSPYIKGAPNCTNWCIATDQLHYIGNTIMWIDAGIDSGDLLLTDTVPFSGDENLPEIQFKVMQAAHELYLGAIALVEKGIAPRVKQASISAGTTYYNRDWNFGQKLNLVRRLRQFKQSIQSDLYRKKLAEVKTISAL